MGKNLNVFKDSPKMVDIPHLTYMSKACQALRYDCRFAFLYLQTAYF